MDANHNCLSAPCLTGGVEAALTTKEADFLDPNGDWTAFPPSKCLAASFEAVKDEDDTRACVAIFLFSFPLLLSLSLSRIKNTTKS